MTFKNGEIVHVIIGLAKPNNTDPRVKARVTSYNRPFYNFVYLEKYSDKDITMEIGEHDQLHQQWVEAIPVANDNAGDFIVSWGPYARKFTSKDRAVGFAQGLHAADVEDIKVEQLINTRKVIDF